MFGNVKNEVKGEINGSLPAQSEGVTCEDVQLGKDSRPVGLFIESTSSAITRLTIFTDGAKIYKFGGDGGDTKSEVFRFNDDSLKPEGLYGFMSQSVAPIEDGQQPNLLALSIIRFSRTCNKLFVQK